MVKAPDNDVEIISMRSASAKRAANLHQASTNVSKCARSSASTSCRSLSPRRDYPRGTDTVTKPFQASPSGAQDRHVHAQDLEVFKADMTSMLADIKSSLTKFASQLKSGSEAQGDSEPTQNVPPDHEKDPSDHDDHSEGRDFASVEELSEARGDPQLENLIMGEQRDFETFTLASPNACRGKTSWKASQENTKFYSQAQQARPRSESLASQARSLGSVDQGQGQAQPLLVQDQATAHIQPEGQGQFPVLLPRGQGRPLLILARRSDLESLFEDENFSLDLDNEAALREKQACSEALDQVAEFCKLDSQEGSHGYEATRLQCPSKKINQAFPAVA